MTLFIKNLLFTLLVPGTVAVVIPITISQDISLSVGLMTLIGFILWLFGLIIYIYSVWGFAIWGKGTPAPVDAPKHLVIRGLYQYMRNPMYIGVLSILLGWTCLYNSLGLWVYWFFMACCFQLFILYYEEPKLLQLFGSEYKVYCSAVNRWLPKWPLAKVHD